MRDLILGVIAVFLGIFVLAKAIISRAKGKHIPAVLVDFDEENDTHYPLFKFTYEGVEYTLTGTNPVKNPNSYKHKVGDTVNVIFNPNNTKYVSVEGSYADIFMSVASFAIGAFLLYLYFKKNGML